MNSSSLLAPFCQPAVAASGSASHAISSCSLKKVAAPNFAAARFIVLSSRRTRRCRSVLGVRTARTCRTSTCRSSRQHNRARRAPYAPSRRRRACPSEPARQAVVVRGRGGVYRLSRIRIQAPHGTEKARQKNVSGWSSSPVQRGQNAALVNTNRWRPVLGKAQASFFRTGCLPRRFVCSPVLVRWCDSKGLVR